MNYLFAIYILGIVAIIAGFAWALCRSEANIRKSIQQMDRMQENYAKEQSQKMLQEEQALESLKKTLERFNRLPREGDK